MSTLSVCLIVKNEEDCIEKCIKSLQPFADEICIYDTGSTDNTVQICEKLKNTKVVTGEWRKDFAWARNQSFSMATSDYIMWVDADDIVDEKSQKWLKQFKKDKLSEYDIVYMMYRYNVTPENTDTLHFYRGRILKRILYPTWVGRIHETVNLSMQANPKDYYVSVEDAYVSHYKHKNQSTRNLDIFRDMDERNEIFRGRDWCYYGNELRDHKLYDEALEKYIKCVDTPGTWLIEVLNANFNISLIYKDRKSDITKALKYAYMAAACTTIPRADVCCLIGDIYQKLKNWTWAKFWYEKAYNNRCEKLEATFLDEACITWKPLLNLCVCEYNLGNKDKAKEYNDMVLEILPNNADALNNKKIFESDNV